MMMMLHKKRRAGGHDNTKALRFAHAVYYGQVQNSPSLSGILLARLETCACNDVMSSCMPANCWRRSRMSCAKSALSGVCTDVSGEWTGRGSGMTVSGQELAKAGVFGRKTLI